MMEFGTTAQHHTAREHFSPQVIAIACFVDMVLAIPVIVMGLWLAFRHHINCIKFLEIPILFIGLALVLVAIVGLVGVQRHLVRLVLGYLVLLFLLLLLLFAFTLSAFFVTSDGGAQAVPDATFLEYNLGGYSAWLQDQVKDSARWASLRGCVKDQQVCKGLNKQYPTLLDFRNAYLSPLQSGCCKPPDACEYTFVKPTQWVTPTHGGVSSDCGLWSNGGLCYNCNTCKAGLLEGVRQDWRKAAKVCLACLIFFVLVYVVSWTAFLKGSRDGYFKSRQLRAGFSQPQA